MHSLASNLHLKIYDSLSAHFEVQRDEWWSTVTSRSSNAIQFDDWICTAQCANSMHSYRVWPAFRVNRENIHRFSERQVVNSFMLSADWHSLPFCIFFFVVSPPQRNELLFVCVLFGMGISHKFAVRARTRLGARCTSLAHMNLTDPYYFYIVVPFDIIWMRQFRCKQSPRHRNNKNKNLWSRTYSVFT